MRAEESINTSPEPRDVYKVSQWKWNIDEGSPWWRKFYFNRIFLPILNFSFGVIKVPAPKEVVVESDAQGRTRRTFRWFEDEGIFDCPEKADAACLGERWGYVRLPYGRLMPPDSAQYAGTVFPRKKNAHKWARPTLSLVIKDRKRDEQEQKTLTEYLTKINQLQ